MPSPTDPKLQFVQDAILSEESDENVDVHAGDVSSDDVIPFYGFEDGDTSDATFRNQFLNCSLTATVAEMADTGELAELTKAYGADFNRIKDEFEDEYQDLDFGDVPFKYRQKYVERFESNKERLKEMIAFFYLHPSLADEETKSQMKGLKLKHINALKAAWESLKVDDPQNISHPNSLLNRSGASTPLEVKQDRLKEQLNVYLTLLTSTNDDFKRLKERKVETKSELRFFSLEWDKLREDFKDLEKQFSDIAKGSLDLADGDISKTSTSKLTEVKNSVREGRALIADHMDKLEIGDIFGREEKTKVNVKLPTFSGSFKDTDYFTFSKKYKDFLEASANYSLRERVLLLKNNCLTGEAYEACKDLETEKQILDHLEALYGKAQILFAHKVAEIQECGRCPTDHLKCRTWTINVNNKLKHLVKLAKDNGLTGHLEHSAVIGYIIDLLPVKMQEDFEDKLEAKLNGNKVTRSVMCSELQLFLDKCVKRATFKVDYKLNVGAPLTSLSLGTDKGKSSNDKNVHAGSGNRKSRELVFHALSSEAPQNVSENDAYCEPPLTPPSSDNLQDLERGVFSASLTDKPLVRECVLCNKKHSHLFHCSVFQGARCKDRWGLCVRTGACPRCGRMDSAFPGVQGRDSWFEKHKNVCDETWVCKEPTCNKNKPATQNHFLVCKFHIKEGKAKVANFLEYVDSKYLPPNVRFYWSKQNSNPAPVQPVNLNLTPILTENSPEFVSSALHRTFSNNPEFPNLFPNDDDLVFDPPIYMVQYVGAPCGQPLLIFYDSGCFGACISHRAHGLLETRQLRPGPTPMSVAGGQVIKVPYGDELFRLPLASPSGMNAPIIALHMQDVSSNFPVWPLTQAWRDLQEDYSKSHPNETLPFVGDDIGGCSVDVMIGIRYRKYYPSLVHFLPSGLEIRQSKFKPFGGNSGVLAGPHSSWKSAVEVSNLISPAIFFSLEMAAYNAVNSHLLRRFTAGQVVHEPAEVDTLEQLNEVDHNQDLCHEFLDDQMGEHPVVSACFLQISKSLKDFQRWEDVGSEISYRCVSCRSCSACKCSNHLEAVSIAEEKEQFLVANSVRFDSEQGCLVAKLPFILDPSLVIRDNHHIALKILNSQLRKIDKHPETRDDVFNSHFKLESKGHVFPLSSLDQSVQSRVEGSGCYIPWGVVANPHSKSTPVRLVFDASSRTPGGVSLNQALARGANSVANLLKLLINFRLGTDCFTTDISLAYNSVKLDPEFFMFQKYLWCPSLTSGGDIITMVIGTLIYGVKPAGNITILGFRVLGDYVITIRPDLFLGVLALKDRSYVDDVISSYFGTADRDKAANDLIEVLKYGNISVKAVCKSGFPPPEAVSSDGCSAGLVGYAWHSEQDVIGLESKPIYLGKKVRGKYPEPISGEIKEDLSKKFTRRIIAGLVASLFDPLGIFTPCTAMLKVELSRICQLGADWDDPLPVEMLDVWVDLIKMMRTLAMVQVPRCVLTRNGEGPVDLLVLTDASKDIACCAVYARQKLLDGTYSCRLVCGKSKLVSKKTVPKAELLACVMGASLAHVVKSSFGEVVGQVTFATDSSVSLFWINSDTRPLQTYVRNCVIEITRLSSTEQWFHVPTQLNPADIGTRKCSVADIDQNSVWQSGYDWMRLSLQDSPLKRVQDVMVDDTARLEIAKEMKVENVSFLSPSMLNHLDLMTKRYIFSQYYLDPLKWPWARYIRRLAVISRCFSIWMKKSVPFFTVQDQAVVSLSEDDVRRAEEVVFRTTTREVIHFVDKAKLKAIGRERDGILRYVGRILEGTKMQNYTDFNIDVTPLYFCNPIIDRYSPVALSIMQHVHTVLCRHAGVPTVVRVSKTIAFILGAKELAQAV